jgi:hypothetical protein
VKECFGLSTQGALEGQSKKEKNWIFHLFWGFGFECPCPLSPARW